MKKKKWGIKKIGKKRKLIVLFLICIIIFLVCLAILIYKPSGQDINPQNSVSLIAPTGCTYFSEISVDNSEYRGVLENYPIKFTLNYMAGMGDNFDSIQFTDDNGNLLSFWIEEFSVKKNATFWVKIDNQKAQTISDIYLWFGGCQQIKQSNTDEVFVWYDDFSVNLLEKYSIQFDESCQAQIQRDSVQEALSLKSPKDCNASISKETSSTIGFVAEFDIKPTRTYVGNSILSISPVKDNHISYTWSKKNNYIGLDNLGETVATVQAGFELNLWTHIQLISTSDLQKLIINDIEISAEEVSDVSSDRITISLSDLDAIIDNIKIYPFITPVPKVSVSTQKQPIIIYHEGYQKHERYKDVGSINYSDNIDTPSISCATMYPTKTNCMRRTAPSQPECNEASCRSRARVELDTNGNSEKVLYAIAVTSDPTWKEWNYVDGKTLLLEDALNFDLNDFLTQKEWENSNSYYNIFGLQPETAYYVRVIALNNDFTTTYPSTSIPISN